MVAAAPWFTTGTGDMKSRASPETGFAQLMVLGGLAAVAGVLTLATTASLGTSEMAAALANRLEHEIAASSAVHRIISAIADGGDALEIGLLSATALDLDVGGTSVALSIEGEGGKINPVATRTEIVEGYLRDLGLSTEEFASLRTEFAGLRADRSASGEVTSAVMLALLPWVAADQIDSDFSPFNDRTGIDLRYASERVLSAFPDLDASEVHQVVERRATDPSVVNGLSAYTESGSSRFSLVATISEPTGTFTRRVPIEITPAGSVVLLARDP